MMQVQWRIKTEKIEPAQARREARTPESQPCAPIGRNGQVPFHWPGNGVMKTACFEFKTQQMFRPLTSQNEMDETE